jgi:hypothetical protein
MLLSLTLRECLENEEYAAAFRSKGPQDFCRVFVNSFDIPAAENDKLIEHIKSEQRKI